eukprot:1008023-Karenia_brevis.AAC.1
MHVTRVLVAHCVCHNGPCLVHKTPSGQLGHIGVPVPLIMHMVSYNVSDSVSMWALVLRRGIEGQGRAIAPQRLTGLGDRCSSMLASQKTDFACSEMWIAA